jgi:hypothetical protein
MRRTWHTYPDLEARCRMNPVSISTSTCLTGTPRVDVKPGEQLRIWVDDGDKPPVMLMSVGVADWYNLAAAVNEAIEAAL